MAEDSPQTPDLEKVATQLSSLKALLAEALASGSVPVEDEIKLRSRTASMLLSIGTHRSDPTLIDDAIQHLDTILRRIETNSPERSKYLHELSLAKFELYRQRNSVHSLSLAIIYGRQARELALTSGLRERDLVKYLEILANLGHVHSFMFGERRIYKRDLEDSIACKREILSLSKKGAEPYSLALNNLASSLHQRFLDQGNSEDDAEANGLLQELLSLAEPGTRLHNIGITQLGVFALAKFRKTGLLEDLDEALVKLRVGVDCVELDTEGALSSILIELVRLYEKRYDYLESSDDMDQIIYYSCLHLDSTPLQSNKSVQIVVKHLERLQKFASTKRSVEAVEHAVSKAQTALERIPPSSDKQEYPALVLIDLLSMLYALRQDLGDIVKLAERSLVTMEQYNATTSSSYAKQAVGTGPIAQLCSILRELKSLPTSHAMRQTVEEEILGTFLSLYDEEKRGGGLIALEEMNEHNGKRWQVIAAAAIAGTDLTDDEISLEVDKVQSRPCVDDEKFLEKLFGRPANKYETELGQRALALDPETGEITFDFTNLVRPVLGYDPGPISPDEFVNREERMEREFMEKGRSKGRYPNPRLCRWCLQLTKPLQPKGDGFELTAGRCIIPALGDWRMVLWCRGECAICSLAASMITTDQGELHADFMKLDQEARGVSISSGLLSSKESVMRVSFGSYVAGELRTINGSNYRQALRQGWQAAPLDSPQSLLNDRGGPIYDLGGQQVNFDMIKGWLNTCDHNHGQVCNHPRPGNRASMQIPLLLIDVIQQCLVPGSTNDKYFALSYAWGRVDTCMTLKGNFANRQLPQGLSAVPFPKTIRDAIDLVQHLGLRFLWVDAVCIIQDDDSSKAAYMPNMDLVYGGAFATIAALAGTDANSGLPGVNPGTRSPQRLERITISRGSSDLDYNPSSSENEILHVIRTPRIFYLAMRMSNWSTRGWTLQERLLSRRCIYFSPEAVYFQCGKQTLVESGINEEFQTYVHSAPKRGAQRLHKANHDNPIADLSHMNDLEPGPRLWKAFETYMELVHSYSKRQLTDKSDIIDGFAGIFAVLDDEHFQGTIASKTLHGIPGGIFVHALLWSPAGKIPRRGARFPTHDNFDMGMPDPRFPSWSWVGWDGPVEYRLFEWVTNVSERPLPLIRTFDVGGLQVFPDKYGEVEYLMGKFAKVEKTLQQLSVELEADRATRSHLLEKEIMSESGNDTLQEADVPPTSTNPSRSTNEPHKTFMEAKGKNRARDHQTEYPEVSALQDEFETHQKTETTSKGKEKATEDETEAGSVRFWRDPNTNKVWCWYSMPQDLAKKRRQDPPLPENVLRMTAPVISLEAFNISPIKEYLSFPSHPHAQGTQGVRRIFNSDNKHCGLYWEQGGYAWVGNGVNPQGEKELIMIGISEYGVCQRPRQGPYRVEGPIDLFDDKEFPVSGPGSELVNILVVDQNVGYSDGFCERVTIAIVHSWAWKSVKPIHREIKIA